MEDAAGQQDPAASTELRQQIERAFREDGQLREEIAAMLPRAPRTVITASGERGVAAYHIDTVISGDNNSIQ
ncbi:hypothetical protein [Kitasatospora sp. NPDC048407]|uniref:hypothetical protein n=1 Tax=Kitasatospora sp. NPDC048407 TaxID=3364051 RepID=UPI003717D158